MRIPSAKHSRPAMRSWWLPVSLKTPVLRIDRGSVVTIRFYLLKMAKNVLGAKNNNFHFLHF